MSVKKTRWRKVTFYARPRRGHIHAVRAHPVPVHAVFIDAVHAHIMLTHIARAHVVNNAFYIRLNNYMPTAT